MPSFEYISRPKSAKNYLSKMLVLIIYNCA